ncbi:MAG: hypothetical protein ABIP53_00745 [Candidatus Limnocylindrales bacterium]
MAAFDEPHGATRRERLSRARAMSSRASELAWGPGPRRPLVSAAIGLSLAIVFVSERRSGNWQHGITIGVAGTLVIISADPSLPDAPRVLDCPDTPYRWTSGQEAVLFVRNERHRPVQLYWTRPAGQRVPIARLAPGDFLLEDSFDGRRFAVTDEAGACLDVLEVTASGSEWSRT